MKINIAVLEGDPDIKLTLGYDMTKEGLESFLKTLMFLCENGMEPEVIKLRDMLREKAAELGVAQS